IGSSWMIQTLLWKNTSDSNKKKLKDKVEHLIGKLPSTARRNIIKMRTIASRILKQNTQLQSLTIYQMQHSYVNLRCNIKFKGGLLGIKCSKSFPLLVKKIPLPSPAIESTSDDVQNKNPSVTETGASDSTILSKPAIKFVKAVDKPTERPTTKKACYNCGGVDHLSYNCGKWVEHGRSWAKNNNTHKGMPPRPAIHKPNRSPMRPTRPNMNAAPRSNNARPKTTQDLMIILIQRVKRDKIGRLSED
nr:hypothetical protein [Tanacetum cinerariifolium]